MKITDPELEREFIIHELEQERAIWLGSLVQDEVELAYTRMDHLLVELYDVGKVLERRENGTAEQ